MSLLNETHDRSLRSWVTSANDRSDFPIQNLPFGVFRRRGSGDAWRCGVAIGDSVVDVGTLSSMFTGQAKKASNACTAPTLNALMALGATAASSLRSQLSRMLSEACEPALQASVAGALVPVAEVEMGLPARIGGFTDFFASIHHATNAGRLFRPDAPLLPNYKHVPIAYNGRANSVRASGVPVMRPHGQLKPPEQSNPVYAPSQRLDYEVELGMFVGLATEPGRPVAPADAWDHIFGFCLVNDWSARDIQSWEYQPLGPFLAKSFATSVSPWIVTAEALAPFRVQPLARDAGDPAPLPHLWDAADQQAGGLSIQIDAHLSSARMRDGGISPMRMSRSNARTLYWTVAQMIAHHTSNGSSLDSGDLLGSGTISGASEDAMGSLLEITRGGTMPIQLPSGEERRFLEDGDEIVFTGQCEQADFVRIGFGECRAVLLPAS
jgi:fumarylacetoacetase